MIQFDTTFQTLIQFYLSPSMVGIGVLVSLILMMIYIVRKHPQSHIAVLFDLLYETVFTFYEGIIWEESSKRMKLYIVTLFFIIFIANIGWVLLDLIAPFFGYKENGDFILMEYVSIPTADMSFNIALSLLSTIILIVMQFHSLGLKKFLYDYFPIYGKWYIEIERGDMKAYVYYPVFVLAKAGDILISLFLGLLDIIGLFAKVLSLAFRLFGNMISGTILLWMLVVGMSWITESLLSINFPVVFPIIVYAQELLVACIQAMVFPLLVAIFIRMSTEEAV